MSNNAPEPSMEEILASIRRIISEDEAPLSAQDAAPAAEPSPSAPSSIAFDEEEAERAEPSPTAYLRDLDAFAAPRPRGPAPSYGAPAEEEGGLLSGTSAYQAASAFGALSRNVESPSGGRTLEDVVGDMLRPMLREWLDANLPTIVEAAVQAEVERIARLRR